MLRQTETALWVFMMVKNYYILRVGTLRVGTLLVRYLLSCSCSVPNLSVACGRLERGQPGAQLLQLRVAFVELLL